MSAAIIKFKDNPDLLVYCKTDSYPAGLGFDLLDLVDYQQESHDFWKDQSSRFSVVEKIPQDIQYEYVVDYKMKDVHCQECWHTSDKSYHGGGFMYGGVYDLRKQREKLKLQEKYSYRREDAWRDQA